MRVGAGLPTDDGARAARAKTPATGGTKPKPGSEKHFSQRFWSTPWRFLGKWHKKEDTRSWEDPTSEARSVGSPANPEAGSSETATPHTVRKRGLKRLLKRLRSGSRVTGNADGAAIQHSEEGDSGVRMQAVVLSPKAEGEEQKAGMQSQRLMSLLSPRTTPQPESPAASLSSLLSPIAAAAAAGEQGTPWRLQALLFDYDDDTPQAAAARATTPGPSETGSCPAWRSEATPSSTRTMQRHTCREQQAVAWLTPAVSVAGKRQSTQVWNSSRRGGGPAAGNGCAVELGELLGSEEGATCALRDCGDGRGSAALEEAAWASCGTGHGSRGQGSLSGPPSGRAVAAAHGRGGGRPLFVMLPTPPVPLPECRLLRFDDSGTPALAEPASSRLLQSPSPLLARQRSDAVLLSAGPSSLCQRGAEPLTRCSGQADEAAEALLPGTTALQAWPDPVLQPVVPAAAPPAPLPPPSALWRCEQADRQRCSPSLSELLGSTAHCTALPSPAQRGTRDPTPSQMPNREGREGLFSPQSSCSSMRASDRHRSSAAPSRSSSSLVDNNSISPPLQPRSTPLAPRNDGWPDGGLCALPVCSPSPGFTPAPRPQQAVAMPPLDLSELTPPRACGSGSLGGWCAGLPSASATSSCSTLNALTGFAPPPRAARQQPGIAAPMARSLPAADRAHAGSPAEPSGPSPQPACGSDRRRATPDASPAAPRASSAGSPPGGGGMPAPACAAEDGLSPLACRPAAVTATLPAPAGSEVLRAAGRLCEPASRNAGPSPGSRRAACAERTQRSPQALLRSPSPQVLAQPKRGGAAGAPEVPLRLCAGHAAALGSDDGGSAAGSKFGDENDHAASNGVRLRSGKRREECENEAGPNPERSRVQQEVGKPLALPTGNLQAAQAAPTRLAGLQQHEQVACYWNNPVATWYDSQLPVRGSGSPSPQAAASPQRRDDVHWRRSAAFQEPFCGHPLDDLRNRSYRSMLTLDAQQGYLRCRQPAARCSSGPLLSETALLWLETLREMEPR